MPFSRLVPVGLILSVAFQVCGAEPNPQQLEFFETRIRPVLVEQCYECHNSQGTAEGELRLDSREGLLKGSEQGPVLVPGHPADSRLIQVLRHEIEGLEMPQGQPRLKDSVIADFVRWIETGAVDPRDQPPTPEELAQATSWEKVLQRRKQWWSFQPIQSPPVPPVQDTDWSSHPVDQFLRAQQEAHGLAPVAAADPATLIRRVSFVLTGLPPRPEEISAFEQDHSPQAYEALVERMLASPQFGERWARHWMDWFRYAESHGSEGDPAIPFAWRYRDYLIRALNADISYDQLVREHLAGDLLPQPRWNVELGINESQLATAQYRFVQHGFAPTDALDEKVRFVDNQIDVLSKALLGVTVSCARCHNHKFDAISQTDFYALYGILENCRPATVSIDDPARLAVHRDELQQLKQQLRQELAAVWTARLPEVLATAANPESPLSKGIVAAEGAANPLHVWRRLQGSPPAEWSTRWAQLQSEFAASQQRLQQRRRAFDLTAADGLQNWTRHGAGLTSSQPSAPGDFHVPPAGEAVLTDVQPGGVFTAGISTKHNAVLMSPHFPFDMQQIHVRVAGQGAARARYVVQNYPRSGTVYPVNRLEDGEVRWLRWNVDYWSGDRGHLEFSTAADQAVEGDFGTERSWFNALEVVFTQAGEAPPDDEFAEYIAPLMTGSAPSDAGSLSERYREALGTCLEAFAANRMTQDQAFFLRHFVRSGFLPTQMSEFPPQVQALVNKYRTLEAEIPVPTRAPGILEGPAADHPLYVRGNHKQPGEVVQRRFLEAIEPQPYATTQSGRLEWADSVLAKENPLTSRVIVNRLWHHVFGRGLVGTPDNLGALGEQPTHPELLDWLAIHFREGSGPLAGKPQSIKSLLKLLVLSRTFQLAASPAAQAVQADPGNQWLTHWSIRRLEAEAIRDTLLQTAGRLDENLYGPPVEEGSNRRSLYVVQRRNSRPPLLNAFDEPVPFSTVGRRDVTNVPGQSLMLLNDPNLLSLAAAWGTTSRQSLPDATPEQLISLMLREALGRHPSSAEVTQLADYLEQSNKRRAELTTQATELRTQVAVISDELAQLQSVVRERVLQTRKSKPVSAATLPQPIAAWEFEDLRDSSGNLTGELQGDARLENGALVVSGQGYFQTNALPFDLQEKTLQAWVQLQQLDQRAGGVMTVQTTDGNVFDAIVFAEQAPREWLAGSNGFVRTQPLGGPPETAAIESPVCLTLTYSSDGRITGYRDGVPYGLSYPAGGVFTYKAGASNVLFGLRHSPATGNRFLQGRILRAQLFDRALSAAEVQATVSGDPNYIPPDELLAAMTPAEQQRRMELEQRRQLAQAQLQAIPASDQQSDPNRPWQDLALTLFNLKEFIYLR